MQTVNRNSLKKEIRLQNLLGDESEPPDSAALLFWMRWLKRFGLNALGSSV